MEQSTFIFTIFFMLLGPIKVVPAFAAATQGADLAFKRKTALLATLFATAICVFLAFAGPGLIGKYRLSLGALSIAGGLVLVIAAVRTMFFGAATPGAERTATERNPVRVAMSPLASPAIVPPAGVAAVLIAALQSTHAPQLMGLVLAGIATMMLLDFLVMYFNDSLIRLPGLTLVLQLLGSALVFVQVALGIDSILEGIRQAGLFPT